MTELTQVIKSSPFLEVAVQSCLLAGTGRANRSTENRTSNRHLTTMLGRRGCTALRHRQDVSPVVHQVQLTVVNGNGRYATAESGDVVVGKRQADWKVRPTA